MRQGRAERNAETYIENKKSSTLKVLLLVIVILALAVAGAVAYIYRNAKDSIALDLSNNGFTVAFGDRLSAMDYVADASGDVTPSEKMLDTASLGDKQIVFTVTKPVLGGLLKPSGEYVMNYSVTDTQSPLTFWSGDGTVLMKGEKFDISEIIGYGDNADREPKVECSGSVDTETAGDYPLHVRVTDASGNSTEWDLTVTVVEEMPVYESDNEGTEFADFVKAYSGEGRSFGIDVSSWQNEIDFEAVKKAGCEFVIIRIGFSSGDGTVATPDNRFSENLRNAKAAGLKVGVYIYSYDKNEDMVRGTARWVLQKLKHEKLDLPVAFDWEEFGKFQTYKMNFRDLNGMYDAFADELAKGGYDCMLYSSKNYLESVWEDTDKRPVWLAHYTGSTDYEGPYMIWQASNTGRIDGINGDVDMDIMFEK